MSDIGHNSNAGVDSGQLKQLIERIQRLTEEKKALQADITDVFKEAKSAGFNVKIMRELLKLSDMRPDDRQERQALIELYADALGMRL